MFDKKITITKLIIFTAIFLTIFNNISFWNHILEVYPLGIKNIFFIISLEVVLVCFIILLFSLVSFKWSVKPILILFVILSAFANYFMNIYNIIIDDTMLLNITNTNFDETYDLLNTKLILYFVFLGVIPSYIIYKIDISYKTFIKEIFSRFETILVTTIIIVATIFLFSKFYTSFFREHKVLRLYTNPTYYIYSTYEYIKTILNNDKIIVKQIGKDAKVVKKSKQKKVVILVIGEAARANRFSLNGYEKDTNPLLSLEDIVNFSQVSSCGTSTAVSVPCMLSVFTKDTYSYKKELRTQNIMDILHRANINILWRDNNSNWQELLENGTYEDFKNPKINTVCDVECRDEGMLKGLDEYIDNTNQDIFIVLHQMGNHGPAYYKRYPKKFEKFKPICTSNQLEQCTKQSISNAYDNAIVYTDYFLSKVIKFLKKKDNQNIQTAMIYLSDHGESLGEGGVYLHGLPYFMAPKNQTHVPMIMWFSNSFKQIINIDKIKKNSNKQYSQDNLFHTILSIMQIKTSIYDKNMDMLDTK